MVAPRGTYHKQTDRGEPLCGRDQLGYMWTDNNLVTCRACQLILKHPEIVSSARELAEEALVKT